jgi:hypothetical protein
LKDSFDDQAVLALIEDHELVEFRMQGLGAA